MRMDVFKSYDKLVIRSTSTWTSNICAVSGWDWKDSCQRKKVMGMEFKSGFAKSIESYLEYRDGMHYGGGGERKYLLSFDQYCAEHFPGENSLTKETVRSWFSNEIAKGHRALVNKAATIRMFARYLGPSSYILPMSFVPKVPQYVPYIMTDDELRALFLAADRLSMHRLNPFLDETIPFLLRFIYACGLRPGEALRLKVDDVDLKTGEVFIKNTKRHKDRIIVASEDVKNLLKQFDMKRKIAVGKSEFFFLQPGWHPVEAAPS